MLCRHLNLELHLPAAFWLVISQDSGRHTGFAMGELQKKSGLPASLLADTVRGYLAFLVSRK